MIDTALLSLDQPDKLADPPPPLVLAVDDDEDILELVALTLRREGCEVIKAPATARRRCGSPARASPT